MHPEVRKSYTLPLASVVVEAHPADDRPLRLARRGAPLQEGAARSGRRTPDPMPARRAAFSSTWGSWHGAAMSKRTGVPPARPNSSPPPGSSWLKIDEAIDAWGPSDAVAELQALRAEGYSGSLIGSLNPVPDQGKAERARELAGLLSDWFVRELEAGRLVLEGVSVPPSSEENTDRNFDPAARPIIVDPLTIAAFHLGWFDDQVWATGRERVPDGFPKVRWSLIGARVRRGTDTEIPLSTDGEAMASDHPPIPYASGLPGRPTSALLFQEELEARHRRGELAPSLRREAEYLMDWLAREHPQAHPVTAKTVENRIRARYRVLKALKI